MARARALIVTVLSGLLACTDGGSAGPGAGPGPELGPNASLGGWRPFPDDNPWNQPIDQAPIDPNSDALIASIGLAEGLHPDFGANYNGGPFGIPYIVVDSTTPPVRVSFDYADESDSGPYPIPPDAPIEGGPDSTGDRHVLVLDAAQGNCILYELYNARYLNPAWEVWSSAKFDLKSNALRPDGWTSADAAGLPILPGLVRYDEVASGRIGHAIRFTAPDTQAAHVWPARHDASSSTSLALPPMGQRFRLAAGFAISGYSPQVQVILRAFKEYGIVLADNGSPWYISGAPDPRWDNDMLRELKEIPGSAFEAVDVSSLMIDPDSGRAAQP